MKKAKHDAEKVLTYGLLGDSLKHVEEVPNGLACNCICPNCKLPLVAKNKEENKKVAHFAHYGSECSSAYETALHLLAKKIFADTKHVMTAPYYEDFNNLNNQYIFIEPVCIQFDEVILEKVVEINDSWIKPDAIAIKSKSVLYVEFANTHFIESEKKALLKKQQVAVLEIDLSNQELNETKLCDFLSSSSLDRNWIVNPILDAKYKKHLQQLEIERQLIKQNEIEKLKRYISEGQYKCLILSGGFCNACPLKEKKYKEFLNSRFAGNAVINKLINGATWNGNFYGWFDNGKWIFVDGEKVFVFPEEIEKRNMNENDLKKCKFLFAALNAFKEAKSPGNCVVCPYKKEIIKNEEELVVCSYRE